MQIQYERIETDELTREMVEDEESLDTLLDWHADQREIEADLLAQISAFRVAQVSPPLGMVRKLGFVRTGLSWLERRILELGGEVQLSDATPVNAQQVDALRRKLDAQARQLTTQAEALVARNDTIKALRARIRELEA